MTAMLIAWASIALWSMLATIVVVARDGYRRIPTDPMLLPG